MPVCIAGMHRSGTSMVAKLLSLSGCFLGREDDLLPATRDNPDGHWEHRSFVEINDEILHELGGGWDCPRGLDECGAEQPMLSRIVPKARDILREFDGREPWGWKDPRNSLTLPFWNGLIDGLKVVVCVRNPLEVAVSLRERGSSSYSFALALWQTYHERVLACTCPERRIVTHYAAYFPDPRPELNRIAAFLGLPLSDESLDSCAPSARASLRHNRFTTKQLFEADVAPHVIELYLALCHEAAWSETVTDAVAVANASSVRAHDHHAKAAPLLDGREARLLQPLAEQEHAISRLQEELAEVQELLRAKDRQLDCERRDRQLEKRRQAAAAIAAGYGYFDNGTPIPDVVRKIYLDMPDCAATFGDPTRTAAPGCFFDWLNQAVDSPPDPSLVITRLWQEIYRIRPDLQLAYPDVLRTDRRAFLVWIRDHGAKQLAVDQSLVPDGAREANDCEPRGGDGPPLRDFGVNVSGYIHSEKGVGEGVRSDIRCLDAAQVPYVLNNVTEPGSTNQDFTYGEFSSENPYPINLIHVNADGLPEFVRTKRTSYFDRRYNIGYWAWELPEFPPEWLDRFRYLDEVWVPSTFSLGAISQVAPVPVLRLPHCLPQRLPTAKLNRAYFGLPDKAFVFLFIFDFHSYFERKNPLALIRAFRQAFEPSDDAMLVIKCSRSEFSPEGLERMRDESQGCRIEILDRVLSREELNTLLSLADGYVSLHRSEGFGLTLAEAMSLAKPVIATGYSGNMDFMTPFNSFLVKYDLVDIQNDEGPYHRGSHWADPHVDHAAELMRHVFENRDSAADIGKQARRDVERLLSPGAVGAVAGERLRLIARRIKDPSTTRKSAAPAERSEYERLIGRIKTLAAAVLPSDASVLLAAKGDDELLQLGAGRMGRHFPQTPDGQYAGHHPEDSAAAIAHLERLREKGATHLLFPATSCWWFDHYLDFKKHLDAYYTITAAQNDACTIYDLREQPGRRAPAPRLVHSARSVAAQAGSPRCSIVIPVFNKASLTKQCLDALLAQTAQPGENEIIVVDDGSSDQTRRLLDEYGARIQVVRHDANRGFASACNSGAAVAAHAYLVFLNNDTLPRAGWLQAMAAYAAQHPEAGIVGAKLLFPDGTIQHAGVVICQDSLPRHIYAGFPADHPAVNKARAFQAVTGACLLIRRSLFDELGGFDPVFVNGCEDIDLCLRARAHGYEVHYCPDSVLYHLESVSRKIRSQDERQNLQVFCQRWAQRVVPDDLQFYVADELLRVEYEPLHPIPFNLSPLLGVVNRQEREGALDHLLSARGRQVLGLLKDNIRLNVRMLEDELSQRLDGTGETCIAAQPRQSRAALVQRHQKLLEQDHELLTRLANQSDNAAEAESGGAHDSQVVESYVGYAQLVERIREVAAANLPPDSTVAVMSKGDDELIRLGDRRRGWHFPQGIDGQYLGWHPADGTLPIAQIEELREKGVQYLLVPATSFWWLQHYPDFKEYLDRRCPIVLRDETSCAIFALREGSSSPDPNPPSVALPAASRYPLAGRPRPKAPQQDLRILIASTPKAGNTWLTRLLSAVYDIPLGKLAEPFSPAEADILGPRWVAHQHLYPTSELLDWATRTGTRLITTVRHPGDVLVSLYHYTLNFPGKTNTDQALLRAAELDGGTWGRNMAAYVKETFFRYLNVSVSWVRLGASIVVRYEDLSRDPIEALTRLTRQIGLGCVCDERLERAVDLCEIGLLRRAAGADGKFFREGRVGGWREVLPAQIVQIFSADEPYVAQLACLGYRLDFADTTNGPGKPRVSRNPFRESNRFDNGVEVPAIAVELLLRADSESARHWGDATATKGAGSFFHWLNAPCGLLPSSHAAPMITNLSEYIHSRRPDLQAEYPDLAGASRIGFAMWFVQHAAQAHQLDDCFVQPVRDSFIEWSVARVADDLAEDAVPTITNLAAYIYSQRADLQRRWPDLYGRHRVDFCEWFVRHAPVEYKLDQAHIIPLVSSWARE